MNTIQDINSPMTAREWRATAALAGIYALRMLGLFMILPVLPLFADELEGATPALLGLAMGVYGLPQLLLQIPFGLLSDRYGRKAIIVVGLLLFLLGSVVAALSTHIHGVVLGRALQGAGAVSAAIMALVADLTQETHRTKAMAVIGVSIGLSFGAGMVLGPMLSHWGGLAGVFWSSALLTVLALLTLLVLVPDPKRSTVHRDAEFVPQQLLAALKDPELLRLDYGIFVLHLVLMAMFVVVPTLMRDAGLDSGRQWLVYLPVFTVSVAVAVPFIIIAEKRRRMKPVFVGAIAVLAVALALLALPQARLQLAAIVACLWLFFCGFNLLEATLPSLVSKTAPGDLKGTAMGAYSSSQFLGLFLGGVLGGWLYGESGAVAVFAACVALLLSWLLVALAMRPPRHLSNLMLSVAELTEPQARQLLGRLGQVEGVAEAILHFDEAAIYLKVDKQRLAAMELQAVVAASCAPGPA